jgi:hypothetical protein
MELAALAFALLAMYAGPWLAQRFTPAKAPGPAHGSSPAPAPASQRAVHLPLAGRMAVVPLFVLALLRTAAESFTPFLYFQF